MTKVSISKTPWLTKFSIIFFVSYLPDFHKAIAISAGDKLDLLTGQQKSSDIPDVIKKMILDYIPEHVLDQRLKLANEIVNNKKSNIKEKFSLLARLNKERIFPVLTGNMSDLDRIVSLRIELLIWESGFNHVWFRIEEIVKNKLGQLFWMAKKNDVYVSLKNSGEAKVLDKISEILGSIPGDGVWQKIEADIGFSVESPFEEEMENLIEKHDSNYLNSELLSQLDRSDFDFSDIKLSTADGIEHTWIVFQALGFYFINSEKGDDLRKTIKGIYMKNGFSDEDNLTSQIKLIRKEISLLVRDTQSLRVNTIANILDLTSV